MIGTPYLAGAAALLAVAGFVAGSQHEHRTHVIREAATQAAFDKTIANVRIGTAKAEAEDLTHARVVELAQDATRKEVSNAYEAELADARRALAAAYAASLRTAASADPRGSGSTDLPGIAQPAGAVAGAGDPSVMADLEACTAAVVKAEQWQAWWKQVGAIER